MSKRERNRLLENPLDAYPATTVACFDPTRGELPRRHLDPGRNVQFLERLASLRVGAVLIAASTGHGHLRTAAELDEWFSSAAEADLGSTRKMALLRPEDGRETNRRLLARLDALAYDVIFVRPGTDLKRDATDEQVASNMKPLVEDAAQRGFPLGVYSIPDVSGLPLTADAAALLCQGPGGHHIVAAKVTEADYERSTRRFLQHPQLRGLKIVQGWDPFLLRALREGPENDVQHRQRCGVTSGPMSLAVHQYLHIFSAADRRDWDEAQASQDAVTQLFQSMQDDPEKFADLQRAKYIMGLGKPLSGDVDERQVQRIFQALESLPRRGDRVRLARSLDLMEDGPYHQRLQALIVEGGGAV